MEKQEPEKVSEQIVLNGRMQVEKATFKDGEKTYERFRLLRQDAAAVLLFNPETDEVILTQQFRYPVSESRGDDILEVVAGKIDEGESPAEAAIREVEEETGYRVTPEKLRFLTSCFSSPGYSTEQFHLFIAEVTKSDKTSKGGGLEEEHEKITLVEMSREAFFKAIHDGSIRDAKTILAGLMMDI